MIQVPGQTLSVSWNSSLNSMFLMSVKILKTKILCDSSMDYAVSSRSVWVAVEQECLTLKLPTPNVTSAESHF